MDEEWRPCHGIMSDGVSNSAALCTLEPMARQSKENVGCSHSLH